MDPSPPKRMTRARAAAKSSESTTKPTRIVTAAAKAKTTRTATTTSTSTSTSTTTAATTTRTAVKRKSPFDEDDELEGIDTMSTAAPQATRGRGRPRKVLVSEPEPAPTVRTRGRPKKVAEPVAEEPVKAARTVRAKRTVSEETTTAAEPVKKTTRGRPAVSTTTTTTTRSLAKPAVKKTVKFEEPEKENMVPARASASGTSTKTRSTKASTPTTAGLRGKPVRKGATTISRTARSTRSASGTTTQGDKDDKPMPLSPKKVNQLTMNRADSDDELGMDEKVPVARLKKMPVKAAIKVMTATVPTLPTENDENAITVTRLETDVNLVLATPAKRLPPSPWKGNIKSPARRVEGLFSASTAKADGQPSQSPTKMGLLQTPAKRQPLVLNPQGAESGVTPLKLSFLSSPAKRPISPIKPLPRTVEEEEPAYASPAPKPTLLASPLPRNATESIDEVDAIASEDAETEGIDDNAMPESPTRLSFPGRLSAVLPRDADPALTPPALEAQEEAEQEKEENIPVNEAAQGTEIYESREEEMDVDHAPADSLIVEPYSTTPPSSPPTMANPIFGLREKNLRAYDDTTDSESDGESPPRQNKFSAAFSTLPATPCRRFTRTTGRRQSSVQSTVKKSQNADAFGFTPLANQLRGWTAGPSPLKIGTASMSPSPVPEMAAQERPATPSNGTPSTPAEAAQNNFFEDEMHVRPEAVETEEAPTDEADEVDPILEDLPFTEEDMALAAEANEMSLMEEQHDSSGQSHDDTLSEASQEYGDENAVPIDPTLVSGNIIHSTVPPVTPQRVFRREFSTVAKVPLKPADDSTPRPQTERRTRSVSRLSFHRPTPEATRNATRTSGSPTKRADVNASEEPRERNDGPTPPMTPAKADIWSTLGTPARTPRRDLNPGLLRGAVVFVDVHTSEGADASGIFVELLTQMGARCVKTWSWNPRGSDSETNSKIGITHVVYKDGGKRTLEKVRESGGVVQCVGVSWVLE